MNDIIKKIKNKKSIISVIGLGYVGLPLAHAFSQKGFKVYGIDKDKNKVKSLNSQKSYIERISNKQLREIKNNFFPITNYKKITESDIIIYCLPTPLKKNKSPDMSYIRNAVNNSKNYFKDGQVISLESTTYPGTTNEYFAKTLEKKRFTIGEDIHLLYSPEREDPGNKFYHISNTTKIVAGYTKQCMLIGKQLYKTISKNIHTTSSINIAEMTKLFENVYRSVNISLVNELKILCNKMDIDIFEIIEAAKTKPFGFNAFYPGPGLGGHCIPIDPFLLSWKVKQFGVNADFIELSGKINERMPFFVFDKIKKFLKVSETKSKKRILIVGAAYKKNIGDTREAPFIKLADLLISQKIKFDYHDPYVNEIYIPNKKMMIKSIKLNYLKLDNYDLVVIITDHDKYNFKKILKNSKKIIDTRGRFNLSNKKIIRA